MNRLFNQIMTFILLAILVASVALAVVSLVRGEFRDTLAFAAMAIVSLIMYLYRKNKKKGE